MFTWFLVTCRSFSIVVQSSLGLDRSNTRTTANDLLKRHYLVKSFAHKTVNVSIDNHTCSTNGESNKCDNKNAKIELNVPTKGHGSFKDTMRSEETFPLSRKDILRMDYDEKCLHIKLLSSQNPASQNSNCLKVQLWMDAIILSRSILTWKRGLQTRVVLERLQSNVNVWFHFKMLGEKIWWKVSRWN